MPCVLPNFVTAKAQQQVDLLNELFGKAVCLRVRERESNEVRSIE